MSSCSGWGCCWLLTVLLELSGKLRFFPLAGLVFVLGFTMSLGTLNVDGLIVRQNAAHAARGGELDTATLSRLSTDAVPALFIAYGDPELPQPARHALGGVLACQAELADLPEPGSPWQGFHWSSYQAGRWFAANRQALEAQYPLSLDAYGALQVQVDGEWQTCREAYEMD